MFRRRAIIYFAVIGWFGTIVTMSVPIILTCLDSEHPHWLLPAAWLAGALVGLLSGIFILSGRKNKYRKVGAFFLVVGLLSLAAIFGAYLKYGYDFGTTPEPNPVGNTDGAGAGSS